MFDDFDSFDQAFAPVGPDGNYSRPTPTLRKRKTLRERFVFWTLNALILPIVGVCYLTLGAEGMRKMMAIFSMRLHKLPIPGAEYLQDYSGFERLDLAILAAFVLFIAVTLLWVSVFRHLQNSGALQNQRNQNPLRFFLLAGITAVIVIGDAGIFYVGLQSQASSGWGETPEYLPLVATILYSCGLALLGAWHSDYHHFSNTI